MPSCRPAGSAWQSRPDICRAGNRTRTYALLDRWRLARFPGNGATRLAINVAKPPQHRNLDHEFAAGGRRGHDHPTAAGRHRGGHSASRHAYSALLTRRGTQDEFKTMMPAYEELIAVLAECGCDLIHPHGAPPFMVQGRKREAEIVKRWEKKYRTPIMTVAQNHVNALRTLKAKTIVGATYFPETQRHIRQIFPRCRLYRARHGKDRCAVRQGRSSPASWSMPAQLSRRKARMPSTCLDPGGVRSTSSKRSSATCRYPSSIRDRAGVGDPKRLRARAAPRFRPSARGLAVTRRRWRPPEIANRSRLGAAFSRHRSSRLRAPNRWSNSTRVVRSPCWSALARRHQRHLGASGGTPPPLHSRRSRHRRPEQPGRGRPRHRESSVFQRREGWLGACQARAPCRNSLFWATPMRSSIRRRPGAMQRTHPTPMMPTSCWSTRCIRRDLSWLSRRLAFRSCSEPTMPRPAT